MNKKFIYGFFSYHNFESRLIIISENISALDWLRECLPNYEFVTTFNLKNRDDWDPIINSDNCYLYKFTPAKLYKLPDDSKSENMNRLCKSWLESYNFICNWINHQRKYVSEINNFQQQEIIYGMKVSEANKILNGIHDNIVFLKNESILKNVSLEKLAESVLLEHEIYRGFLARTEFMRIKWLNKLKSSDNILEHGNIIKEFQREMYEYHRLS